MHFFLSSSPSSSSSSLPLSRKCVIFDRGEIHRPMSSTECLFCSLHAHTDEISIIHNVWHLSVQERWTFASYILTLSYTYFTFRCWYEMRISEMLIAFSIRLFPLAWFQSIWKNAFHRVSISMTKTMNDNENAGEWREKKTSTPMGKYFKNEWRDGAKKKERASNWSKPAEINRFQDK